MKKFKPMTYPERLRSMPKDILMLEQEELRAKNRRHGAAIRMERSEVEAWEDVRWKLDCIREERQRREELGKKHW